MKKTVTLGDKKFRPFISQEKILGVIDQVAERINADYVDTEKVPIILCVLNGSIPFVGHLLPKLKFNCELVSIKLSSYVGTESSGDVKTIMGLTSSVEGRDVIICEDIVETGRTIQELKDILHKNGAAEVKICTMLFKPDCYESERPLDYVGLVIDNDFIVGFGLDYNEAGRNLKDIYVIDES